MTLEELRARIKAQVVDLTEAQAAAVLRAVPLTDKIRLLSDADGKAILEKIDKLIAGRTEQASTVTDDSNLQHILSLTVDEKRELLHWWYDMFMNKESPPKARHRPQGGDGKR